MIETSGISYWFGFRQTYPKPPGSAVACGPYASQEEAMVARENAKAWDCSVSIPFVALLSDEATAIAERMT